MAGTNEHWNKAFIAFGVVTAISGIYLIIKQDYVIGICGTIVGLGLISQNKFNKNG